MSVTDDERLFYDLIGDFISGIPKGDIRDALMKGRHKLGITLRARADRRKAEEAAIDKELSTIDWRD